MSEDTRRDPAATPGGDPETGEPIRALKDLEHDTSFFFLRGIRRRIYRRTTVSQLLSASWELPGIVLSELAGMFKHVLSASDAKKEE